MPDNQNRVQQQLVSHPQLKEAAGILLNEQDSD